MKLVEKARSYVETRIASDFHDKRLASLDALKLDAVLKRKNPYLFKAKGIESAPDLVKQLLSAHLSSQEETLFGAFLEGLAIYLCGHAYGGQKSTTEGIDLEFTREATRYIVSIKSGPNWGNSSQITKMVQSFDKARRIAGLREAIVAVNGCCYGKSPTGGAQRGGYLKLCGQDFWELISGEADLYQKIVEPLGTKARERNDAFERAFGHLHTRFAADFITRFCQADGAINWEQIVAFNSASASGESG